MLDRLNGRCYRRVAGNLKHFAITCEITHLMVVAIAVRALRDLFKSVIIQLAEKTGVAGRHGEVLSADQLLKSFGDMNMEGPTMGHPSDTGLELLHG